jgi:hypothetical protein
MLRALSALMIALAGLLPAASSRADHAAAFVVPMRPGIPVIVNGRDVSWAVVEGDWGLHRPGHMPLTIIGPAPWTSRGATRPVVSKDPWRRPSRYYPAYGSRPDRGRVEVEPPPDRLMPEPAESFSRIWSTHSESQRAHEPVPATITNPNAFAPPIIVPHIHRRP